MEHLPTELIQRALAYLDLPSLRNAALSCRVLFNAFKGAERVTTSEILLREIDDDEVLPEAILVNESWHLSNSSVDEAIEFAKKNLQGRKPARLQWNLTDALPLARFHTYVRCLAAKYSHDALATKSCLVTPGDPFIRSREIFRFERAFYRFQLYCNIVGKRCPVEDEELKDMFFGHFSAWENEQLACVQEFLVRLVAPPYNYFVDHDVTWGYLGVAYIDQHSCDYAQEILSQGLEKIYHLSRASTYEQLHKLLSLGEDRWNEPGFATWFLDRGLECGANWVPLIPDALSLLDDEDGDFVIGRPFYDDSDPGPTSMWEWVYRDDLAGEVVASSRYIAHRQWGFPFWNSSRLRDALLLGNPDIPGPIKSNELGLEAYSTPERLEALKESQKLRSAIWSKEGTGFFSRQDQTKIVWPKPSRPEKKCSELPRALEEAKKSLVLSIDETGVECIVIQQI